MNDLERLALLFGCKVTLILGLAAVFFALAGRRWPQYCMLWQRWAVMALLVLPMAVWALPSIGIAVLSPPRSVVVADAIGLTRQHLNSLPQTAGAEQASGLNRSEGDPTDGARESGLLGFPSTNIKSIAGLCLAVLYAVVVLALIIQLVRAWLGLAQLKRASSLVIDPLWQTALKHWSMALQVGRPVELRISDAVSVPMTFYWRAPVILIPGDCLSACNETERDAIVVHELTHIAHGDFFWQTMTRLTAALYWVHPLMWLIRRQDGALCERICDALCSQYLSRKSYALALVRIAGRNILRPTAALGIPMAHASSLRRRLTDLQATTSRYSLPSRTQQILLGGIAGLILGLIVVGTLTARASAEGAKDEEPPAASSKNASPQEDSTKATSLPLFPLPATIKGPVLDQQDKPVVNAEVTVKILRCDAHGIPTGAAAPEPWSAKTNDQGWYKFETGGPSVSQGDVLKIKVRAESFPETAISYFAPAAAQGILPVLRLYAGRKVVGRIVDPQGNPVAETTVRFQASSPDFIIWDSGPLPVDQQGVFSVSIPKDGEAAVSIYPSEFAPRIVKIPEKETDLGDLRVKSGTSLMGRVVDKAGRGIAGTVVAIQGESLSFLRLGIRLGTAVKTDENGKFRLPPVRGTYRVLVTNDAPDYSRQLTVKGVTPPPILPQRIDFNGEDPTRGIIFHEAESVTVQGTVRWPDGSGVPDVEIEAAMLPPGWKEGTELASTRTDSKGGYILCLPAPVDGVIISAHEPIRAPDGTFHRALPVGHKANAPNLTIDRLTADVNDADWMVRPDNK